jgi:hypothetical protein
MTETTRFNIVIAVAIAGYAFGVWLSGVMQ